MYQVCSMNSSQSPIIKNELTNKTKVSGNASQAIKVFLNKLLTDSHKFNIEKTPPELTIYNSYITDQFLHKKIKEDLFELQYQQVILEL